jgi:hypothetical protein
VVLPAIRFMRSKTQLSLLAAAAALALAHSGSSQGAVKTWAVAASGNWTTSAAWSPANPPVHGDTVMIDRDSPSNYLVNYDNPSTTQLFPSLLISNRGGGVAQLRTAGGTTYHVTNTVVGLSGHGLWQIGGARANVGLLEIGEDGTASGTVTLSTGTLTVTNEVYVGALGTGFFSQSGGLSQFQTNVLVGVGTNSTGNVVLNDGTMNVPSQMAVANFGTATFQQNGGTHTVGLLDISLNGGTGLYNLAGGILSAGTVNLRTNGTFNQTGGTIAGGATFEHLGGTVTGTFTNNGTYRYTSGTLTGRMINNGALVFNADATLGNGMENHVALVLPLTRTLTFNGLGLAQRGGTLTQFGNVNSAQVFVGGGTFNQQGSVHAVTGNVSIGSGGAGTYNLNNGTLNNQSTGGNVLVGVTHTGFLSIGNGTLITNTLRVGAGAAGTLNHGGTGDVNVGTIEIGVQSVGRYNHNNATGAATASTGLIIGTQGQYDLVSGSLTAAQTSNNGSFNQTGGVANLNQIGGSGDLSVLGTASLSVDRIRQDSVFIGDNARVVSSANGGANGVSRMNSLFFEEIEFNIDGRWDVNNNDIVVDYVPGQSPATRVRSYIASGFAAGNWNGDGLISSAALAAANSQDPTGLGYAEASAVFSTFPATFVGQSVDSTTFLVRYTLLGDNNLDGTVGIGDFANLATNFNEPGDWVKGDYNYNGMVTIGDFAFLASNYNQSLPRPMGGGAVPEPTVAGVLLALAGVARRRRHAP